MEVLPASPPGTNPATVPNKYRQLTTDEERVLLAAKITWEETEKSKQNFLHRGRIFTFAVIPLSFAAISLVESHVAVVALMTTAFVSALFFLMSFTFLNSYIMRNNIPIQMKVQIKIYDFRELYAQFAELAKRVEGCNLSLEDQLVDSIRVKINAITKKMEELENLCGEIGDDHIPNLKQGQNSKLKIANLYRNFSLSFSETKTLLHTLNETLCHAPLPIKEQSIDLMKQLSEKMNELLDPIQELSFRFQ